MLRALGPAAAEFVIAGGQAARLMRLHPLARRLEWEALLTRDVDLATREKGHLITLDLHASLEREGFAADLSVATEEVPPVTLYLFGESEVELLVPERRVRRAGGTTTLVLGASAQKVADLEPLLLEPVEVVLPDVGVLQIPNPGAYVIQKVLTFSNRPDLSRKGKDGLYVHDILQLFNHSGSLHPQVIGMGRRVLQTLTRGQRDRLRVNVPKLIDSREHIVIEAAAQAAGRGASSSPAAIALAIRLGLKDLLGE